MKRLLVPVLAAGLSLVSCGKSNSNSQSKDLGSDLGNADHKTYMYWVEGESVVQGECSPGNPVVRTYCLVTTKTMSLAQVDIDIAGDIRVQRASVVAASGELRTQITAIDEILVNDPQNQDLIAERQELAQELETLEIQLAGLDAEIVKIEDFFTKLKYDRVVYRVMEGSDRYAEIKDLVLKLSQIFSGQTPPNNQVQWTDAESERTFLAKGERLSFDQAAQSCHGTAGEWHPIRPFINNLAGCNDDFFVAKRLFASPIMRTIPETQLDINSPKAKIVWSRCQEPNGRRGIAVTVDQSANTLVFFLLPKTLELPVLCEGHD